jgi:hypothetical protein
MRFLIGCSGAIALVVLIIGFAVSMLVSDATWTERLIIAGTTSGIAFAAAFLLFTRDSCRYSATMRTVRRGLLAKTDTPDEHFVSLRPSVDAILLLEIRNAISRFFDVPAVKVARDLHLIHDLHVDKLDPSFQFYVVDSVVASRSVKSQPFWFAMTGIETIDDLSEAIRKVLDGLNRNAQTEGETEG